MGDASNGLMRLRPVTFRYRLPDRTAQRWGSERSYCVVIGGVCQTGYPTIPTVSSEL
jgi:hypothetical protein